MPWTTRSLGPASLAFPLSGAAVHEGRLAVVSRNLDPPELLLLDLERPHVLDRRRLPAGAGAWGAASDGRALYVGLFGARGRPNLIRYERGSLTAVALLDVDYIWDLAAAPDTTVYGVTAPDLVLAYDPATRLVRIVEAIERRRDRVRTVAADARTVWVGGARDGRALLLAVARGAAGPPAVRDVLPAPLRAHAGVYVARTSAYHLALGTRGPGATDPALGVLDRADPRRANVATVAGQSVVDSVTVADGAVWGTTRPDGALVRLDLATSRLRRVAVPVEGAETRGLFAVRDRIVGASATGAVWSVDRASGALEVLQPADFGVRPRPELVQALAAGAGGAYVGGNFGFTAHDLAGGGAQRHVVPGEPKDLVVGGGRVWIPLYPTAQLWSYASGGRPVRAAQLPVEQNRPVAAAWDELRRLVVIGTASDRLGGGALHVFDPARRTLVRLPEVIAAPAHPASLAAADGTLYVGGSGGSPALAAVELPSGRVRWRLAAPVLDAGPFTGAAVAGPVLLVLSLRGWLLAVERASGRVLHRLRLPYGGGRLAAGGGRVWGATADALLAIDPLTFDAELALTGLGSRIWGWPPVAADESGAAYAVRGSGLVRVVAA